MICIDYLCNVPKFIDTIVEHLWCEWHEDYIAFTEYTSYEKLKIFYSNLGTHMPTAYVMHSDDELLGMCLIDVEDMQMCPHLTPWLACLYVLPEHRKKGNGSQLLQYVLAKHTKLYLWTFTPELAIYYNKFGFIQKHVKQHGHYENAIVMQYVNQSSETV